MTRAPSSVPRAVLVGLVAVLSVAALPGRAMAHGGGPELPDSVYYRAGLSEVVPEPAGVRVSVDPAGEWIELANAGAAEVIVLGYTGEPYLRVTSTEVEENQLSQSTYLNRSLFADAIPAAQGASSVAPAWQRIGGNGAVRWHDHRIHWMGQTRPPAVAADPRHAHQVGDWIVHATADGAPFEIRGNLRWIGKPDAARGLRAIPGWVLWSAESIVLVIAALVLVILHQRRRLRLPDGGWAAEDPLDPADVAGSVSLDRERDPASRR